MMGRKKRQLLGCHWSETESKDEERSWRTDWSIWPFISFYYYSILLCQASFPIRIFPKKGASLFFFFFALSKLAKAFLISFARSSWAGPWPLSFLPLRGGMESREGDRQVTYLIVGVGSALSKLASQSSRLSSSILALVWFTVAV